MYLKIFQHHKIKALICVCALIVCCSLMMFGDYQVRLHWINLPGTLLIAFLAFWFLQKRQERKTFKQFYNYIFNRDVWFHPSAVNDYIFVSLNVILLSTLIDSFKFDVGLFVALGQYAVSFLPFEPAATAPPLWVIVLYTLCHIVVLDFCLFLAHYMLHKIPALWALHKVHHSAQSLTPFTAFRIHPLETIFSGVLGVAGVGISFGVFLSFYPSLQGFLTILGVNVGTILFNFFGANLRHSHIWLSYGPKIERYFISPAQHHYHHSAKVEHFDKNMGFMFSVWDRLFGTLHLCGEEETLEFGLGSREEDEKFQTVWGMFVVPIVELWHIILGENTQFSKKIKKDENNV